MTLVPSRTIDNCIVELTKLLQPFCAGEIVRGQANRVPLPSNPCIVLTELFVKDIETPSIVFNGTSDTATVKTPRQLDVQIDFYGDNAGDMCSAVTAYWRSSLCANVFPDWIKPLWAEDGIQAPLIDDENQWQSRWTVTVHLQYNPELVLAQEFADTVTVAGIVAVDVLYPA